MERKAFLDQEAPPGYVAGSARGDVGFSTSAETGASNITNITIAQHDDEDDEDEDNKAVEDDKGLLVFRNKDQDDEEADRIYLEVENRLNRKRKSDLIEAKEEPQNNQVVEQFSELKRGLSSVSADEWASLPDPGDFTRRNKRNRLLEKSQQRFYAAPDSLIVKPNLTTSIDSTKTDFHSISESKDQLLGKKLDMMMVHNDSEKWDDIPDLKALESHNDNVDAQMADVEKGRQVLASLRKTYPNRSSSWISSARLEEQAKNYNGAKSLIEQGCALTPHDPEIWLENIRIHQHSAASNKLCKMIVTEALKFNSSSETLWIKAVELETPSDILSKKRILMKALESIPTSVTLWKELINTETEEVDVRKLLEKAIELCPHEWDFYLSLIKHSSYKESRSLLNKARKNIKSLDSVWITALKLEESEQSSVSKDKLEKMFRKGIDEINNGDAKALKLMSWLERSSEVMDDGFPASSDAITQVVLKLNDEAFGSDIPTILSHATEIASKSTMVSYQVYRFLISKFPNNIECWAKLFSSLKSCQPIDLDLLFNFYSEAINLNPNSHILALMFAKDKWILGNSVQEARNILKEACSRIPENQDIWFARIKLETKTSEYQMAHNLSNEMVKALPKSSPKVWYKHIHLLRCLNYKSPLSEFASEISTLCNVALNEFPKNEKLYLQKTQMYLKEFNRPREARDIASVGVKSIPTSARLWIALSQIDEKYLNMLIRARSDLDSALLANSQSDILWDEKIWLERRSKNINEAKQLTNKALKLFPNSPHIWKHSLSLITKSSHRKNAFMDALKNTNNSPIILLQIGIFFWLEGSYLKAKLWFERSIKQDERNGDSWAWLYLFITKHGSRDEESVFLEYFSQKCDEITHGATWNKINKCIENFENSHLDNLKLTGESLIDSSTIHN